MARLVVLSVLLLCSLLAVFRAPALYLWYLAIVVSELPLLWLGLTSLALVWGIWAGKYGFAGTIVGVATFALFLSPVIRAYRIGVLIDLELDHAFNADDSAPHYSTPFSFSGMFTLANNVKESFVVMTYKTVGSDPLTMDFYESAATGVSPCVIVVHGGSWSSGDSRQLPELNAYLASKGYHVASINYRLAPQCQGSAATDDLHDAIAYLKQHAGGMRIDTSRLVLLGRSAGAQIALSEAYRSHDKDIKGVVNFYGPADMIWGYQNPASPLVLPSCKIIEDYFGGTYSQAQQVYKEGSPIEWVDSLSPPTLTIHGTIDPLVAYEHSTRLETKLQQHGVKHYLLSLPWGTHGCDASLNGPGGQLSTYAVERFLGSVVW